MNILDHIVFAVPDLESAVDDFEVATGVRPVFGGRHTGQGTANYLVSLEWQGQEDQPRTSYLELIGPDPEQPDVAPEETMFQVGALGAGFRPRIHTWAVHPLDLDATVAAAAAQGVEVGEVRASSRLTPAGHTLAWRLTRLVPLPLDGMQPFLIDWGNTPHPAANPDLPTLVATSLRAEYPVPGTLRAAFDALGLDVPVSAGVVPTLILGLDTPHGPMDLR